MASLTVAHALTYPLPNPNDNMVGELQTATIMPEEHLSDVMRQYEMGYQEFFLANPELKNTKRKEAVDAIIPSWFILPDMPYDGAVINLPEFRLYYYPVDSNFVITEPVAVGRQGWRTPMIEGKIVEKIKDPEWVVPNSIWNYKAAQGVYLPRVMPAGPDNPLGQYALRLSVWSILIHGTNEPIHIGKRVSSGCIRMYPEDIEDLFYKIPIFTSVFVINEPYKVGWYRGKLYLQIYPPFRENNGSETEEKEKVASLILNALHTEHRKIKINWNAVEVLFEEKNGIPGQISE